MRFKIPDKGWLKALETVVGRAQPGDTIVASSEDMKALGEMALARRFPGKVGKVTFIVEEKMEPQSPKGVLDGTNRTTSGAIGQP